MSIDINLTNFANSWRHFKVISSALNLQGKVAKFLAKAQLVSNYLLLKKIPNKWPEQSFPQKKIK